MFIPKALRSIAAQFASFDSSSFYEATADADTLSSIPASGEKALTWTISAVSAAKTDVENSFKSAKEDVASIKVTVQNMNSDWSGDTYNDLLNKVTTYEATVAKYLDQLIADYSEYMSQAQAEFDSTESSVKSAFQL